MDNGTDISTDTALDREYARATSKTVARDLNQLIRMELVAREKTGYRACLSRLREMRPVRSACASDGPRKQEDL